MGNKLLETLGNRNNGNDLLNSIKKMGPSGVVFNNLYSTNPQFKAFADQMRGKTPEDAFREKGLNFNNFRNQRW